MRRIIVVLAVAALCLAPASSHAASVTCGKRFSEGSASCTFTYMGGQVFIAGVGRYDPFAATASQPLGPPPTVQVQLLANPADPTSVLNSCTDPGSGPPIGFPAACADGSPSAGVPTGTTLTCIGKGAAKGFFLCTNGA